MKLDKYIKDVGMATDYSIFNGKEFIYTSLNSTDLFLAQYFKNDFNAVDIAVKYLAIENFYDKNNFGMELYKKLQLKRIGEDWTERYIKLIRSFENGINMDSPIQVDLNYSIHDGSHRLALALYNEYEYVPVNIFNVDIPRRYYGINWFKENEFTENEIILIKEKLLELLERCRKAYFCILWPPSRFQYTSIANNIELVENSVKILQQFTLQLKEDELKKFIYDVYETDDITKCRLDLKYEHILKSLAVDGYNEEFYTVYIIKLKINNPDFRLKPLSGLPQSRTTMRIKKYIREIFKDQITDYYYDIIMHMSDNQFQNDAIETIIAEFK